MTEGVKVVVTPAGTPPTCKVTLSVKPFSGITVAWYSPVAPATRVRVLGVTVPVNVGAAAGAPPAAPAPGAFSIACRDPAAELCAAIRKTRKASSHPFLLLRICPPRRTGKYKP